MKRIKLYSVTLILIYTILGCLTIYHGRLIGDEGWYAYISVLVYGGKLLYKDFLFSQMPLLPYFYGLFMSIFGQNMYVGRWISFGCGTLSLLLIWATCRKRESSLTGIYALMLFALNLNIIYAVCVIRTQALTVLWLALSLYFLASPPDKLAHHVLASIFSSLALLTRLSILPATILLWLYQLWLYRRKLSCFGACLAPALLILCGVLGYFFNPNMRFGVLDAHGFGQWSLLSWSRINYFLSGFFASQTVICVLILFCLGDILKRSFQQKNNFLLLEKYHFEIYLILSYLSITLLHAIQPLSYVGHQMSIIPLGIVFASICVARFIVNQHISIRWQSTGLAVIFIVSMLSIYSQKDILRFGYSGTLAGVDRVVSYLHKLPIKDKRLLAFDASLAVQSQIPLLPGYEMSEFSFAPYLADDFVHKRRMINLNSFKKHLLQGAANIICLRLSDTSGLTEEDYTEIIHILDQKYPVRKKFMHYGHSAETLVVYNTASDKKLKTNVQ